MAATDLGPGGRSPDADPPSNARPRTGRLSRLVLVALLVALVAAGVWVVSENDAAPQQAEAVGESVVQEFPVADRVAQTPFTANLLDGGRLNSTELAGQVVVYNVWGSWCAPCVAEAPDLVEVATETAGEVRFVGINVRDNDAAARSFERSYEVPYPSVTTADSANALLSFPDGLAGAAVPTTLVVDTAGRVAVRVVGPVTAATLRAVLDGVLAGR